METFHYKEASLRETLVGITSQRHAEVSQKTANHTVRPGTTDRHFRGIFYWNTNTNDQH